MTQKVSVLMLALTLTATWLGISAAQQPATGQMLRVFTTTVAAANRDQVIEGITQSLAAAQGVLWFKVGTDAATGEVLAVALWSSQAAIDAFLSSDERSAAYEKTRPLMQGEPSGKNYSVAAAKK